MWKWWNPIEHVTDAWKATNSIFGKIAVVTFYSCLWLFIIANAHQAVVPESSGLECMFSNVDEYTRVYFDRTLRGWCCMIVFWMLYVENTGLTIPNLCVFLIQTSIAWFIGFNYGTATLIAQTGMDDHGCFDSISVQAWLGVIPICVELICLVIDQHVIGKQRDGTQAEQQPLVV